MRPQGVFFMHSGFLVHAQHHDPLRRIVMETNNID
jgi:hypothetical protein